MSKVNNTNPLERLIHQTFHDLADKYKLDVDLIAEIIKDFEYIVDPEPLPNEVA